MSKPYHEMTPAERLADRIAKNRAIDQRVMDKKPAVGASPGRKTRAETRRASSNALDRFQEIKRTHGIDAASDFVHERIKTATE
jgi:hypothetical protein